MARWMLGLLGLGLLSFSSSQATAQTWTRFHGPNGTGALETEKIPTQLTPDNILWKTPLPGIGHAAPVIWGNHLFTQSAIPEDGTQVIICLDATTGKMLWEKRYKSGTYHIHDRNSFASSTPTVDARHVYASWATPEMLTVTAITHDGQQAWQMPLGPFDAEHGFGTSPIVHGDLVIQADQQRSANENERPLTSSIVALDAATGDIRWRTPRKSAVVSYSAPCVYQPAGSAAQLICCSTAHGFFGLELATGKPLWEFDVFTMRTVSSPLLVGDRVLGSTGSGAGGNYLISVRLGANPEVEYKIDQQAPYVPTSVARGDLLFLWSDKGIVSSVAADNSQVHWRERVGGNYSGSPVRAGSAIYCISETGELVVLAADTKYQVLSKLPLGEPSRSTPALTDDRLYIRTDSTMYCIGQK
ncbi:MAG: PQQ-binding-like beta-propeller repeat protein [Pirellulales bacterium]